MDGVELSDNPLRLWDRGQVNDVDLLLGTNTDEGVLFVYPTYPRGIIGKTAYMQVLVVKK